MTKNSLIHRWSHRSRRPRRSSESYWMPRDLAWIEDRDAIRAGSDLLAARDRSSWT